MFDDDDRAKNYGVVGELKAVIKSMHKIVNELVDYEHLVDASSRETLAPILEALRGHRDLLRGLRDELLYEPLDADDDGGDQQTIQQEGVNA